MSSNSSATASAGIGREDQAAQVAVFAPARLHLGFLDLEGGLGRRFGGLGLAIDGLGTRLRLAAAPKASASGPGAERALRYLAQAAAALDLPPEARIIVDEASPEHAGFGSGTQLGLAVAAALARLYSARVATPDLAKAIGRGARSGIGIGAFDSGGFLVDGGLAPGAAPAPVIARLAFPAAWRVLLLLDPARQGLHGSGETAAFGKLPAFSEALAGRLCRVLLLRLLPGLAEHDFAAVSSSLGEIQERLGDYFSAAQNGRYSSPGVAEALIWLKSRGILGIGQSSWGPTGFALFASLTEAEAAAKAAAARFAERHLDFRIVGGRNRGADLTLLARE
jgi:beta-ribofuranosylaminobenzene 5'-phosphate synthase